METTCAVARRRLNGVRFGVARGALVIGALGAQLHRYHFFGGAAAEAARLAGEGEGGDILVQVREGGSMRLRSRLRGGCVCVWQQ